MTAIQQPTKATLTLCLSLLMLCSSPVLASDHGPKGATTHASSVIHRQVINDDGVAPMQIFSNLGPADDLYDASRGYFVSGRDNQFNDEQQGIAVRFTPVQDATVTRVKIALQYYGFGTNGALVAIYDDAKDVPGKVLAKRRRGNFDNFGACCDLALWTLTTPLLVKAGVQYWVVGITNKKTKDAVNMWDLVFDDKPGTFAFEQDKSGWILLNASAGYAPTAVAVRGTVP